MSEKQNTLIYIQQENKNEAEFMSRSFVNSEIKNRAYLNALGAELMIQYLKNEGIDASETNNLHSISKILEEVDISDILLPNIHIDVRVIFDENQIFIPQQHFLLGVTPDIYTVLKISKDFTNVEFLGYFEPKLLNPKNKNSTYYFIEQEKLSSPETLKSYIESFKGNTSRGLSQEGIFRGRELSILMADHNISKQEQVEFFKLLLASSELRESVLEFDNFETLSFSVGSSSLLPDEDFEDNTGLGTAIVEDSEQDNSIQENEDDEAVLLDEEPIIADEILSIEDGIVDNNIEELTSDDLQNSENNNEIPAISIEQDDLIPDSELTKDILPVEDNEEDNSQGFSTLDNLDPLEIDMNDKFEEDLFLEQSMDLDEIDTSVVETTITETLNIEDTNEELPVENILDESNPKEVSSLEKGLGDAIAQALKKTAGAAANATAATAATSIAGEAIAAAGATSEAMKLAGISGDLVNDLVDKSLENQQTNLDKIDYEKTNEYASTEEIPENISAMDLSTAKMEANIEAEVSGKFDTPMDLSELKTVEVENLGYGEIEHETIDFSGMEAVEMDEIKEDVEDIVNLNNISSIDSPTKPVENQELQIQDDSEFLGMEMPNMSTYTINQDGSSPFDDMEINLEETKDEHLVDFNMDSADFNLDNVQEESSADLEMVDLPAETVLNNDNTTFDNEFDTFDDDLFGESSGTNSNQDFSDNAFEQEDTESKVEETLIEDIALTSIPEQVEDTNNGMNDEISAEELFSELGLDDDSSEFVQEEVESVEGVAPNELDNISQDNDEQQVTEDDAVVEPNNWVDDTEAVSEDIQLDEQIEEVESVEEPLMPENIENEQEINTSEQEYNNSPVIFNSVENSRIISDKNFCVGEIPIDINNIGESIQTGPEQLEDLYDSGNNIAGATMLNNPGTLGKAVPQAKKGLGIVAVVLTLIIVGAIGFAVSKMMKPSVEEMPQPISDEPIPMSPDNGISEANTLKVEQDNVVNMDNTVTTPVAPAPVAPTVKTTKKATTANNISAEKSNVQPVKKVMAPTAFLEVKKLSWEVPDYVSYNQDFKQYFQSAGKSLKLSLTSDLLLATEPAYSRQIRVTVTFAKDGVFKDSRILLSSGSAQIDNIVLQTVNQTLKVLKAPHSIGNDESTTVILKIYL